ncbi:MAG: T9SS type A sorting domain-containing protein [Lentimicrobium sp.]|nr:T9SS type A sorting domain-containing protein [Lentimicrobium sp.]
MKKLLFIIVAALFTQTINAQCIPDRHSTSWYDGWVSCSALQSPNPDRGISHWIMYNFGKPYCLTTSTIWNSNDPAHLEYGLQGYAVDYSLNGIAWSSLGTFSAGQATGSPFYEGTEGPDFNNAIAQFVLVTALSNYGGSCFGISEMKINIKAEGYGIDDKPITDIIAYPNPFNDVLNIKFFMNSTSLQAFVNIYDLTGRIVFNKAFTLPQSDGEISISNDEMNLVPGIYNLYINNGKDMKVLKVVKI